MMQAYPDELPLVELLVRNSCELCEQVALKLRLTRDHEQLYRLVITNVDTTRDSLPPNRRHLTPGVWVNGKLWYTGDFDSQRFANRLKKQFMVINHQYKENNNEYNQ